MVDKNRAHWLFEIGGVFFLSFPSLSWRFIFVFLSPLLPRRTYLCATICDLQVSIFLTDLLISGIRAWHTILQLVVITSWIPPSPLIKFATYIQGFFPHFFFENLLPVPLILLESPICLLEPGTHSLLITFFSGQHCSQSIYYHTSLIRFFCVHLQYGYRWWSVRGLSRCSKHFVFFCSSCLSQYIAYTNSISIDPSPRYHPSYLWRGFCVVLVR